MAIVVKIYGNYATLSMNGQTYPSAILPNDVMAFDGTARRRDGGGAGINGVYSAEYRFIELDEVAIGKDITSPFGTSQLFGPFSYVAGLMVAGGATKKYGVKRNRQKMTSQDLATFCDNLKLSISIDDNNMVVVDDDLGDNDFVLVHKN